MRLGLNRSIKLRNRKSKLQISIAKRSEPPHSGAPRRIRGIVHRSESGCPIDQREESEKAEELRKRVSLRTRKL